MSVLEHLQPEKVFYYFEEICRIPHGSGNTKAISDYVVLVAKQHQLEYIQDEWNNVVIYKNASAGYEDAPVTILQGHLDMVAEKTADSTHDFMKDGLQLFTDGDLIGAEDTTLGADDGIAVAFMLAILSDNTLKHPALECVFTVDEEIGLLGAKDLDTSVLKGKYMINLDSEEEGCLWISCAGGLTGISSIPVDWQDAEGEIVRIHIHGLTGGHSGAEIDKNRANANILMGRFLYELNQKVTCLMASCQGGAKDNAIPVAARMTLVIEPEDKEALLSAASATEQALRKEFTGSDEGISISVTFEGVDSVPVLSMVSMEKIIFYLMNAPYGVAKMSGSIPGLVETSNNIGIVNLTEDEFVVSSGVRSSVGSAKKHISDRLCYLTEFLGGEYTVTGEYPAWEYKKDSALRELMVACYRRMFEKEPVVKAIHAGLECGIFYENIEGLDCISFGPDIFDIHTVKERLSISSTKRMWEYLVSVLENIN